MGLHISLKNHATNDPYSWCLFTSKLLVVTCHFPLINLHISSTNTFTKDPFICVSPTCLTSRLATTQEQEAMGAGSQVKGVGGYRPTINWREISIRKKNVADRQVLACIVLSGVFIILVGVVITILGFLVIDSEYL